MTAKTQPQVKAADQPITVKSQNLWKEALGRLRRNRAAVAGGIIIILLVLTAIFAEQIAPYSYDEQSLANANTVPEWIVKVFPSMKPYTVINNAYPLGADALGRDLFSRIVYGTRVSLAVAFIGPIIALFIGVIYGSVSGFFSGGLDNIMMRVVDVLYAFPGLLFIILLMAFFRTTIAHPPEGSFSYYIGQLDAKFGGLLFIMIGIGLTSWETQARLHGGQVLSTPRARIYRCSAHHWCEGSPHHVPPYSAEYYRSIDRGRNAGNSRLYLHGSFSFLHWFRGQPANTFVGVDDRHRLAGPAFLSQSGTVPGTGAGHHHVCL